MTKEQRSRGAEEQGSFVPVALLLEEQTTLEQVFDLGLYQCKVERALALYRDGVGSLGYIAEQLGLSKRDLIQEARMRGIEPDFSEETVQEELA
ncbi:MAG: hypothetical protein ACE5I2_13305 [Anaerolineae bacterium]